MALTTQARRKFYGVSRPTYGRQCQAAEGTGRAHDRHTTELTRKTEIRETVSSQPENQALTNKCRFVGAERFRTDSTVSCSIAED